MATAEEVAEAYGEWRERSNANPRLRKMVKGWDRVVHLTATDTSDAFTIEVRAQELTELHHGHQGVPDLVVTGTSEDFADMFWGDLNPSEKYLSGEIVLRGSQQDVMRLDAISMVAFLDA